MYHQKIIAKMHEKKFNANFSYFDAGLGIFDGTLSVLISTFLGNVRLFPFLGDWCWTVASGRRLEGECEAARWYSKPGGDLKFWGGEFNAFVGLTVADDDMLYLGYTEADEIGDEYFR